MVIRSFVCVGVLTSALVVGACDSGGDAAGEDPTPTSDAGDAGAAGESAQRLASVTTTTMSDEAFDQVAAGVRAELEDAEGDLCELVDATSAMTVTPTTEEQTRIATDLVAEMIRAMGRVAEPGDADAYEDAADRLEATAEREGYSPEWISGPDPWDALDDPGFVGASERLQTRFQQQCPEQAGPG